MKKLNLEIPDIPTINEIKQVIEDALNKHFKDTTPDSYTKKEFAELIGKSTSWIDSKRRLGQIEWFKVGETVRIPHSEYLRLTSSKN